MDSYLFENLKDPEVKRRGEWDGWDWAAHRHPTFKPAFQDLVEKGCDGPVLIEILRAIQDCQDPRSSPDDLREIRAGLDKGRDALLELLDEIPLEELF